jgi:hypothetical protein
MLTRADITVWAMIAGVPVLAVVLWRRRPGWSRAVTLTGLTVYLAALIGLAFGGIPSIVACSTPWARLPDWVGST